MEFATYSLIWKAFAQPVGPVKFRRQISITVSPTGQPYRRYRASRGNLKMRELACPIVPNQSHGYLIEEVLRDQELYTSSRRLYFKTIACHRGLQPSNYYTNIQSFDVTPKMTPGNSTPPLQMCNNVMKEQVMATTVTRASDLCKHFLLHMSGSDPRDPLFPNLQTVAQSCNGQLHHARRQQHLRSSLVA